MDKYVLGISAFYHDSAAALIKNNEIIAAAQEERFTRKKHDPNFPINAINYCLEEAFIEPQDLDLICFYDHPFLTLDRVMKNSMMVGNDSLDIFKKSMQSILSKKIWVSDILKQELNTLGQGTMPHMQPRHFIQVLIKMLQL
jgi:carbamoyltransferase